MFVTGDISTIIADIGTETLKIGYSGTESPSTFQPTKNSTNNYTSPLTSSIITNIPSFLSLLCPNLPRGPQKSTLLLAENSFEPPTTKKEILSYLMERKEVEALLFVKSGVLDMFSYGKSSGLVVSVGGGSTQVVGVVDGYLSGMRKMEVGGLGLTQAYKQMMEERLGEPLVPRQFVETKVPLKITPQPWTPNRLAFETDEIAREAKESTADIRQPQETPFELPTGQTLHIGAERQSIPNRIFESGLIEAIKEVIEHNDHEIRNSLLSNIVISGSGVPNGFLETLVAEIGKVYPPTKVKVSCEKRISHTYFGGSVVGSLGSLKGLFIGSGDYEEYGESIVDRKKCEWIA